jgi:methionyl-tRNA formyltransferase
LWKGKFLKILKARIVELQQHNKDEMMKDGKNNNEVIHAGQIIEAGKTGLLVACGSSIFKTRAKTPLTALSLLVIKPQGKDTMHFNDFINGYRIKPGDSFE